MDQRSFNQLVERLEPNLDDVSRVVLTDEEIASISAEQADELVARFGSNRLMLLPKHEQRFFSWLREKDEPIWTDLWGGDEDPYLVSLGYLKELLPGRRGFLICDLAEHENFCFTAEHITPEEGKLLVDAALETIQENGKLSLEQAFVVEVWRAPIDLWRFAFLYNVKLDTVKQLVEWLIAESILIRPSALAEALEAAAAEEAEALANGNNGRSEPREPDTE